MIILLIWHGMSLSVRNRNLEFIDDMKMLVILAVQSRESMFRQESVG